MTEPALKDNARLAERLLTIGKALRDGGNGRANGRGVVATMLSDELSDALVKGIALGVKAHVAEKLAPLEARNAMNEQRISELEAALAECLKDGGTWKAGQTFTANEVVSYHGTLWRALRTNSVRPGTTDGDWRMMTKSRR